jgi:hypothetical protein
VAVTLSDPGTNFRWTAVHNRPLANDASMNVDLRFMAPASASPQATLTITTTVDGPRTVQLKGQVDRNACRVTHPERTWAWQALSGNADWHSPICGTPSPGLERAIGKVGGAHGGSVGSLA